MRTLFISSLVIALGSLLTVTSRIGEVRAATPENLAFFGVRLQNDNAKLEPTTEAEHARVAALGKQFVSALKANGRYDAVPVPDEIKTEIASGQPVGECGGCEAALGKQMKVDRVAWVTVQKVSNLILNINVFVADPKTDKLTFLKSVDVRGNTDESWSRSMKYLLDNYFLGASS